MKTCKCGMPIYDRVSKICARCFIRKLKTPTEKNLFAGGRFYDKEKKNPVGYVEDF